MSTEEKMTIDERRKYLRCMKKRYVKANRKERSRLLDEMVLVTDLDRKTLIRLMAGSLKRKPRQQQRGRAYAAVDGALPVLAETLDHICAERMTPRLVITAQQLARHGALRLTSDLLEQLGQISVSTVQRRLKELPRDEPKLLSPRTKTTNSCLKQVPMCRIPWDQPDPGHLEADLVHHCGPSASGEYVHTLQLIDVNTGWSERRALLGRSFRVMQDAFLYCLERLPFPALELHPDNGSEFFNHHLLRFFAQRLPKLHLSRSRPYNKNDNRFVEQKNASLVRSYLGDLRFETADQTIALNVIYDKMWLYYNFFQPVMRLQHKQPVVSSQGTIRPKRVHDVPRPPFDRLCESNTISDANRSDLEALRDRTNPLRLRREIRKSLDELFKMPGATPGITENIFRTLSKNPLKGEGGPVTFSFDRTASVR